MRVNSLNNNVNIGYLYELNNQKNVAASAKQDLVNVSSEEKKFFSKLYPDSKNEISNYHFYSKSGQMQGVSIGSLIDRRG